jgi:hypothetical protein
MMRRFSTLFVCATLLLVTTKPVYVQSPGAAPAATPPPAAQAVTLGDITVSGSVRARSYSWNWFEEPGGDYTYPGTLIRIGLNESRQSYEWLAEFAIPLIIGLPSTAVAPPPKGQLGLGGSYFAANNGAVNNAAFFLKRGYLRFKAVGGVAGQAITVGRMESTDGAEVTPGDATLATLKRDRISQRLLGTFGFSDVGRSIDGAQYVLAAKTMNVTALAGRPTQGVFQVNGWPELNINVFYGAFTKQVGAKGYPGEWRVFALGYDDYRHGVIKTDNRPAAVRAADTGNVVIGTYGGHYLQLIATAAGPVDVLAWAALQSGKWGALTQRAAAYALEGGWQPTGLDRINPWFRGGFNFGSGDGNPSDGRHGTFFQVMPTPRIYARLPFFNLMNTRDAFGEAIVRPQRNLTFRMDVHALSLARATDLWYTGGGAFQPATFGYSGRPSNGHTSLATLYDVSGDYALTPRITLSGYYGDAVGRSVAQSIFPAGDHLRLAYAEFFVRF